MTRVSLNTRQSPLRSIDGNPAVLREITELFHDHSTKALEGIRRAIAAGDAPALEYEAHAFRGSVGVLYARPALEAVSALERIGRPSLNLIYITHAHIDHFGGAAAVQRATGAPIAVHGAAASRIRPAT